MKVYLAHVLNTILGLYQEPFSTGWDAKLNEILDNGSLVEAGPHTISYEINGDVLTIWTSNKWYSFGHLEYVNGTSVSKKFKKRPRLKTMIKLWRVYSVARDKSLADEYQALFKAKPI